MNIITVVFITIFAVLIGLFIQTTCSEDFYIEPNTIVGGAMPDSGMVMTPDGYKRYSAPLRLGYDYDWVPYDDSNLYSDGPTDQYYLPDQELVGDSYTTGDWVPYLN